MRTLRRGQEFITCSIKNGVAKVRELDMRMPAEMAGDRRNLLGGGSKSLIFVSADIEIAERVCSGAEAFFEKPFDVAVYGDFAQSYWMEDAATMLRST